MSRTLTLATLFSIILIDSIGYSIIVPVLAPILLDSSPQMMTDASPATRYMIYGIALGLYDLVMLYSAPLLGEISDQIGRKKVLAVAMVDDMQVFIPRMAEALQADVVRMQVNEAGSALHEIGGLRMGTDPTSSVTDPWGCFHHLGNLSVADSAAWPYQGPANSYLTITAWALRQADVLAKKVRAERG